MTTWVCEDPDVIELVNAATELVAWAAMGREGDIEYELARLREAAAAIRIPEDER